MIASLPACLIAPKFVTPFRMTGKLAKNDAADAAAICEAVIRPKMRFVPIKTVDQQGLLTLHRVRQEFIEQRIAICPAGPTLRSAIA